MEIINIEGTATTPEIELDLTTKTISFSGKSLPEDAITFYKPVINWLDEFSAVAKGSYTFSFKLDYFNTASSKVLLDIFMKLETVNEGNSSILIQWYYQEDDEDIQEAGEEYSDIVEIPFKIIPY